MLRKSFAKMGLLEQPDDVDCIIPAVLLLKETIMLPGNSLLLTLFCGISLIGLGVQADETLPAVTLNEASAETGLLTLARAHNKDIYLDATNLSVLAKKSRSYAANEPAMQFPVRERFVQWAQDHKLSSSLQEESALFWVAPEIEEVGQQILQGKGIPLNIQKPDETETINILQAFIEADPQNKAKLTTPFDWQDLPPELGWRLAATVLAQTEAPSGAFRKEWALADSFWQNARVTYRPSKPGVMEMAWPFRIETSVNTGQGQAIVQWFWAGIGLTHTDGGLQQEEQTLNTPQGRERTHTITLFSKTAGQWDYRLKQSALLNQANQPKGEARRLIEKRPALSSDKTPWQKVEDDNEFKRISSLLKPENRDDETRQRVVDYLNTMGKSSRFAPLPLDTALDKTISLEMQHRPLSEFLAELTKQSGVSLKHSPLGEELLITARVAETPLRQVMSNLTMLYGIEWQRTEADGYLASVPTRDDWLVHLLQFGDMVTYRRPQRSQTFVADREQQARDFTARVWEKFGAEALTTPNSIAFSDLPDDVQQAVRQKARSSALSSLVQQQLRVGGLLQGALTFQLNPELSLVQVLADGKPQLVAPLGLPSIPRRPRNLPVPNPLTRR